MFSYETIRIGQPRAYADSYYEFIITSDLTELEIRKKCFAELRGVDPCQTKQGEGWPDVMKPYYSFSHIGNQKYRYLVTEPYTG